MPNKPQQHLKFYDGFGANFRTIRELHGLTQEQLAEEINFTNKTISLIESEKRNPTIEQLNVYAEKFNVSLDFLTGRTKTPYPDVQLIQSYTGLSESSIQLLENTQKYNAETWYMDIINAILESEHFKRIIYLLTESITRHSSEIKDGVFKTTTNEIAETIVTKEFHLLIAEMREKFKNKVDDRIWYTCLRQLYDDGKITDLQYEQTKAEFKKGNYKYNPLDGGAENGKHNPSKE